MADGYPSGGVPQDRCAEGLAFVPLLPAPDVAFWQRLTQLKLDELRLDERPLSATGFYEASSGMGVPPKCFFTESSFAQDPGLPSQAALVNGELKNFNTKEEFRDFLGGEKRQARVAEVGVALRKAIVGGEALKDPKMLRQTLIVAFADLKKYHFAYTVAMPVLAPPADVSWSCWAPSAPAAELGIDRDTLGRLSQQLRDDAALAAAGAWLLVRPASGEPWEVRPLAALSDSAAVPDEDLVVAFTDPSGDGAAFGWPMRNLLVVAAQTRPGRRRFLAFRDPHLGARADAAPRSRALFVVCAAAAAEAALAEGPVIAGWSKIQNFDLTAFLDKKRIAADAVDLNVKLMKWRLLPELEPERMKSLRFLLLGAGTLGCGVARTLMGWGVRKMTFVDSGRVSLSNPVRQNLFTHEDAAQGRLKATAARDAVKAVMPDAEVESVEMEIPMPGHPHQSAECLRKAVQRLQDLVSAHDIVLMLTDSRESRWLPSLLIAAAQRRSTSGKPRASAADTVGLVAPLGLTVALGFDSFLVSRQTFLDAGAACYFCNDMSAPSDSLAFRTLDQQCTVTRPGVSGLASNVAVELIAGLVQHSDGFSAAHSGGASASAASADSPLGVVPHQIRGYLAEFRLAPAETEPFPKCICCSTAVLARFEEEGMDFIEKIISDSSQLERVSGLHDMKAAVREDDVLNFDDFDDD